MSSAQKASAREGALDVLLRIEDGAYANIALDDYLEGLGRGLSPADRGLLTELVVGTVKHRLTLDWIIDRRVNNPGRLQTGPRLLLCLGLYQLRFLDRIPARAAVYETVELARRRHHAGVAALVNAALRSWQREGDARIWPDERKDPAGYLSALLSHPLWIVERWLARYGYEKTRALCEFNNTPPPLWLRTNTLKTTPPALADRLEKEGCRTCRGRYAPEALRLMESPGVRRLEAWGEGLFTVQDESSMLAAYGLAPLPGHRVLDVCAAPGGKTTHLAQLMEDRGSIAAWDLHPHRVELLRENQRRLGIRCIEAYVRDAAQMRAAPTDPADKARDLFDRVLVDAPCSGLGTLRRRADARWNRKPEDIVVLAQLQERILRNALARLTPGGKLLYSTCTTEPEENSLLVEAVLAACPEYKKARLSLRAAAEGAQSLLSGPADSAEPTDPAAPTDVSAQRDSVGDGDVQFLPFLHGLEGFYMALIEHR